MTNYVLDAHTLLWHVSGDARLGDGARAVLNDPNSMLFLPAIALAEACWVVAHRPTRIVSVEALLAVVDRDGRVAVVPLDADVIAESMRLDTIAEMHDRQIAATTILLGREPDHRAVLLTRDADIRDSGVVEVLW